MCIRDSRSDALSSVAVLIGVGGNMAGVPYLDQIAAIVVSVFVVRAGILIAWEAYKDLVDTAVDYRLRNRIIQIIESTDGVQGWHRLRTRKVGAAVFVDMHIAVADELSIREAHKIADRVDHTLTDKLDIDDVIVHIEPQSVCRESEHDKS